MKKSAKSQFNLDDFNTLYFEGKQSLQQIADSWKTNVSALRRYAIKQGIALRNRSENQKLVLSESKAKHPTKGQHRSDETKHKIAKGKSEFWKGLTNDERQVFIDKAKEQWNNMTVEQKDRINQAAHAAIRKTADEGSKLENFVKDGLKEKYVVMSHIEKFVKNDRLEMDLLLPAHNIVIEIDGPSHYLPIWGKEALEKTQSADNQKNGLLMANHYYIVRLIQTVKHISGYYMYQCLEGVKSVIENIIDNQPSQKLFYVKLGDE